MKIAEKLETLNEEYHVELKFGDFGNLNVTIPQSTMIQSTITVTDQSNQTTPLTPTLATNATGMRTATTTATNTPNVQHSKLL